MNVTPKDSSIINVCIIPPTGVGEKCIEISQSLKSPDTLFVLGEGKFAHMTLFMARYSNSATDIVMNAVLSALNAAKNFKIEHSGYFITKGDYLEVSYQRSAELLKLQDDLIAAISDYRISPGHPYEESYFAPYTHEQRKNAEETGYDLAGALYRPHITLTRYEEGTAPRQLPRMPEMDLSFDLNRICAYRADENGAVYKLLKKFEIK